MLVLWNPVRQHCKPTMIVHCHKSIHFHDMTLDVARTSTFLIQSWCSFIRIDDDPVRERGRPRAQRCPMGGCHGTATPASANRVVLPSGGRNKQTGHLYVQPVARERPFYLIRFKHFLMNSIEKKKLFKK